MFCLLLQTELRCFHPPGLGELGAESPQLPPGPRTPPWAERQLPKQEDQCLAARGSWDLLPTLHARSSRGAISPGWEKFLLPAPEPHSPAACRHPHLQCGGQRRGRTFGYSTGPRVNREGTPPARTLVGPGPATPATFLKSFHHQARGGMGGEEAS